MKGRFGESCWTLCAASTVLGKGGGESALVPRVKRGGLHLESLMGVPGVKGAYVLCKNLGLVRPEESEEREGQGCLGSKPRLVAVAWQLGLCACFPWNR